MGIPFGRYELLKRIAAGGMGEVFLARQAGMEGFEKLLVVKVLLPNLAEDEEFVGMFLDEARIAARLNHPNIAQIYDLGEVEGALFIAMEYVHGEDVVRIWRASRNAKKPVPLALAARIAADAAAGLDYAHKAMDGNNVPLHIVHRDVSPQNVLVTFEGGVKVIDFGVAKAAGRSSHTAAGTLKGKYSYMSPEQADGRAVDHRSDVFALGVVLYEMATSLRLFKRDNDVNTLKAVAECQVLPPSARNADIEPALEAVILKALAKDPEARYPDAGALRLALEDWIVEARRPGSSAHLSAYMKDLYSTRLAEERQEGKPFTEFEGTPSAVFGRPGSRGSRGSRSSRSASMGGAPAAPSPAAAPSSPRRRKALVALGALLALGLGAAAVALSTRSAPKAGPPPEAARPAAAPVPVLDVRSRPPGARVRLDGAELGRTPLAVPLQIRAGARLELALEGYQAHEEALPGSPAQPLEIELEKLPPEPPAEVELRLVSAPAGAQILLEGRELGRTPYTWRRPRAAQGTSLTFRLPGYQPRTEAVDGAAQGALEVRLVRAAAPRAAPAPDNGLDIKTGR